MVMIFQNNQLYYFLIWKNLYIIRISQLEKIKKRNTETLVVDLSLIDNNENTRPIIEYNKYFKNECFINMFIDEEKGKLLLFDTKGEIYKFSTKSMKLKQIIKNDSLSSVIDIAKYNYNYIFLITVERSVYMLNLKNNDIMMIYQSTHTNNLIMKKGFSDLSLPFLFFVDENNYVLAYSLISFDIIKKFNVNYNEYNYIFNNLNKSAFISI